MKRKTALLLLICMAFTVFAACADAKDDDKGNTDIVGEDEIEYLDSIPEDYNLNGQQVGFLYSGVYEDTVEGDDETLDIVYTRVYERNVKVEARLNVDLNFINAGNTEWKAFTAIARQYVTVMDDTFQAVITGNNSVIQEKIFNLFHNLNDSAYIDIGADWWFEDTILEVSIDNYYYRFLYGDINMEIGTLCCILYNKDLYSQYVDPGNPEGLYDEVKNGTWTLERFAIAAKDSYIDLGGENDIYGFTVIRAGEPVHYFAIGCGIEFYQRDSSGKPIVTVNSDKSVEFTTKLYDLLYNNVGAHLYYPNMMYEYQDKPMFVDGKYIFELTGLNTMLTEEHREMEAAYGILPYPKWDEAQEEYITESANGSILVGCTRNADIEFVNEEVSAVIEALASEAYRSVTPAFYETALKKAYSRDDTTAQMIDVICGRDDEIKSRVTKNFLYEYSSSLAGVGYIFNRIMGLGKTGTPNFTSTYESLIDSENTQLNLLWEEYLRDANSD